jgi:integrase
LAICRSLPLRIGGYAVSFKTWRDSFAATPRKADYAWTTLARIMSFAKDRGMITANPCEKGGRLYAADRSDKIWGETEIAALLAAASDEIKLALVLALWTGQRQGDLLRLPWSSYDGTHDFGSPRRADALRCPPARRLRHYSMVPSAAAR